MGVLVSWLYRLTGRQDNCLYCVIYCSTAQLLTVSCYFLFGFRMDLICFKGVVMCPSSLMLNHLDSPMALFNWKWHHVSGFWWCLNQIVDERETLFWNSLKFCLFIQFYHSCWVFERGWKKDFTLSSLWCNCREILIFSYTYCGILYLFFCLWWTEWLASPIFISKTVVVNFTKQHLSVFSLKHSPSFCEGETLKRAFNARLDIPKGLTWPRPSSSSWYRATS